MKYLVFIFLLYSCHEHKKWEPTELQKKYLATLPLEGQVYFESCLCEYGDCFDSCMKDYKRFVSSSVQTIEKKSGPSTTDIAIGTALGYGAAKVIMGTAR